MMLTRSDRQAGEARLRYLDADIQVLSPGNFVMCAVTGRKIPLQALRYWSVERQEPYATAQISARAHLPESEQ